MVDDGFRAFMLLYNTTNASTKISAYKIIIVEALEDGLTIFNNQWLALHAQRQTI